MVRASEREARNCASTKAQREELPVPATSKRKPGRPRVLDDDKRREICALVTAGSGLEGAAEYVGCAAATIRREAGRNAAFDKQLREAALAAELAPLQAIRDAARTNWRAAAWFLERHDPQRFARRPFDAVSMLELQAIIEQLVERLGKEFPDDETRQRIEKCIARLDIEETRERAALRGRRQ